MILRYKHRNGHCAAVPVRISKALNARCHCERGYDFGASCVYRSLHKQLSNIKTGLMKRANHAKICCFPQQSTVKRLYKYNAEKTPDRNKIMKINERWEELKEASNANIQSRMGILKRQTRSTQT